MTLAWCVLALVLTAGDDQTAKADEAQEIWPMPLREALRIGLENSKSVRVTFAGDRNVRLPIEGFEPSKLELGDAEIRPRPSGTSETSIVVEAVDAHADTRRTRSDVTAIIRPIENQYWQVEEAHFALWAADRAVELASELIENEHPVGNAHSPQDFTKVTARLKRLKQLKKQPFDRTADVIAAERKLRILVGLPASDNRRIVAEPARIVGASCADIPPVGSAIADHSGCGQEEDQTRNRFNNGMEETVP